MFGLDTAGTFVALGALLLVVIAGAVRPGILPYLAVPVLLMGGLALLRVGGTPLGAMLLARVRWLWGAWRGHTRYRAGVVVDHPRAFQLPGVLAPLTLLSAEDGYGGRYGIVWDRRSGLLTATLRVIPSSTWLADQSQVDAWVACWGNWLASLGHQQAVRWVSVTVDTAPEPGSTLADSVIAAADPASPEPARRILAELVATAPAAAADVDTRVSVTFDPKASATSPKDLLDAVAELGRILEMLASRLGACGVTVLGRATAAEIAGSVRTAFDPHARGEVNRLLSQANAADILTWADAGPVAAAEFTDRYEHDGGVSVSWAWHEPPRQSVPSSVLARLVAPGPFAKRVTLQYRVLPAAQATKVLELEVNAAAFRSAFRRKTGRDETARDAYDAARARQAAAEEAMGAGVSLVALYATVTVTDEAELRRAVVNTEAAAESSKIRLRRLWGGQATGFATTLPCGICPPDLFRRWKR